jgi:hypothetical protein
LGNYNTHINGGYYGDNVHLEVTGSMGQDYKLERSTDLASWQLLANFTLAATPFVCNDTYILGANYARVFYRVSHGSVQNGNMVHSDNIFGVYRTNLVGSTQRAMSFLLANSLNSQQGNTIDNTIMSPPTGTILSFWNETVQPQRFDADIVYNGSWGTQGSRLLNPGQGVMIKVPVNRSYLWTTMGDVPQGTLANPMPTGFAIRSSMVPQSGTLSSQLGYNTPQDGDSICKWNTANQAFDEYYTYFLGEWSTNDPVTHQIIMGEPVIMQGEAFFSYKESPLSNWTRTFTGW